MALTDLADYKAHQINRPQLVPLVVAGATVVAGRTFDLWTQMQPGVGAAVTTAAAPTRATTGARGQLDGNGGVLSILGANWGGNALGSLIIADRLSHQGGLSAIVTTAQTTNLPTAALTRYTSGVGVMLGLTIYTQIGTTATTVTVSYTNSDGTAGRVTPAVAFGGTAFREANRLIMLPLQSGDVGVQSVQSVTVLATTGTAGAFGVTLFKPLHVSIIDSSDQYSSTPADFISGRTSGGIPEVVDGACLFGIYIGNTTSVRAQGELLLAEV